jgi:hypothetical protein
MSTFPFTKDAVLASAAVAANHAEYDSVEYYDAIPFFWDDADKVNLWLEGHPGFHAPSAIRRGAKVEGDVYRVLSYLERKQEARAAGNGTWRKYAAR